jgi:hypothetical protein
MKQAMIGSVIFFFASGLYVCQLSLADEQGHRRMARKAMMLLK